MGENEPGSAGRDNLRSSKAVMWPIAGSSSTKAKALKVEEFNDFYCD